MAADSHAFVFADLSGYTALTEAHGDEYAADLVSRFVDQARELLERCAGDEIKLIGDELMLRIDEPAAAIELALELASASLKRHRHLAVRVGLNYGPAVQRGDDWFGATINIAARIAARAQPGEVLTTAQTADAAGEIEGVTFRDRGPVRLRNVRRPIPLVSASRGEDHSALERDPVCHMLVDPEHASERLERDGRIYWFCSTDCRRAFEADPEVYD